MSVQRRCPVCKNQVEVTANICPTCEWTFMSLPDDISDQELIEELISYQLLIEKHVKLWREQHKIEEFDAQTAPHIKRNNEKDSDLVEAEPVQEVIFYWSRKLGGGVVHDYAEAVKWCRNAAEQGDTLAQCDLGRAYEEGKGVSMDVSEAKRWYRSAAELGCTDGLGALIRLCKKLGTYNE